MRISFCYLLIIFLLQGCAKTPVKLDGVFSVEELGFHKTGEKFIAIDQHILLTNKGNVYSINSGYDKRRWKGVDKDVYLGRRTRNFIGKIDFLKGIKKVLVANNSFLALTNDGEVYSWGGIDSISKGGFCSSQLGLRLPKNQRTPVKISGLNNVVDISYFSCTSSFVTDDGRVFRWGFRSLAKGRLFDRSSSIYARELNDSIQLELLEPNFLDIPVKTKAIGYRSNLSHSGEIFMLLSDVSAEKLSKYINPVSPYVYKYISNSKAVDNDIGIVLLDDFNVVELPATIGTGNRVSEIIPAKKISNLGKVKLVSQQSLVTFEGKIYRWGGISYEYSKDLFFPSTTSTRIINSDTPVYIETQNEELTYFSRDAYITGSGEVYLYGSSKMNHPVSIYGEALAYVGYSVANNTFSKNKYHRIIKRANSNIKEEL